MKRLIPEELPEVLTPEIIKTLVEMAIEFPKKTSEWAEVSQLLEERGQLYIILDKVEELQKLENQKKKAAMTQEEKQEDQEKWKKLLEDDTPRFLGNMGQPETVEEYKNRYGVYPPGYDKDGNKIIGK